MKKRILITLTILITLVLTTSAFCYDEALLVDRTPFAYEKITVATDAVSRLNATHRAASGAIFITVEDNAIRYRIDGGDPDVDDGHLVIAATYQNLWLFDARAIRELRMIALDGNATVIVTYYRRN